MPLPFRFLRLDSKRYVATNFVGEYAVLAADDLQTIIRHRLPIHSGVYNELKAKHFLFDGDSQVALDLLACRSFAQSRGCYPSLPACFYSS